MKTSFWKRILYEQPKQAAAPKTLDRGQTYVLGDASLEEIKGVGVRRWQRTRNRRGRTFDAMMVPLAMFVFFGVLVLRTQIASFQIGAAKVSSGWLILVSLVPLARGGWSLKKQVDAQNQAAEDFLSSPSVRKNGD